VTLVLLSAPAMMFVLLWMPQFLEQAHHVAEDDVGRFVWLPSLGFAAGAVVMGAIASALDKRRSDGVLREHGALLAIAGVFACALALIPYAATPWTAVFFSSMATFGGGALFSRLTSDMLARVDPTHTSMAGGFTAAAQSLAYVVASPIVGKVVDATHSFTGAIIVLGLLNVPGVVLWLAWPMWRR
jgi:MFS family permease